MQQLLRHKGRSAVVISSAQGLELKGSFVRTRMVLSSAQGGEQEVALFLGSPRLEGLTELQVSVSRACIGKDLFHCFQDNPQTLVSHCVTGV